jgi:hypothetical protein
MDGSRVLTRIASSARARPRLWLGVATTIWLAVAGGGLWLLWQYDNTPGISALAPERWPAATSLAQATDRPTIVMLAHPHCSCTRASLGELAEALARAPVPPKTYVLFMTPSDFETGWEDTDLWRIAAGLSGAVVIRDADGREARHFGAVTSGQTIVYTEDGRLAFSGGITGARAHPGDNAGRQSLVALLNRTPAKNRETNVFGCPLFSAGTGS